jgi:hypothetical protein
MRESIDVRQAGNGFDVFGYLCTMQVQRKQDNTIYAMKRMELTGLRPKQLAGVLSEAQLLSKLDHPRIVKTFEAWIGMIMST